ncbi:MAG TPA: response regulator [Caulobacterales bacterium]|nr:response regulator [Caulobacterales bacterium]
MEIVQNLQWPDLPTALPAEPRPLQVLVVEDDEADAYLIERALARHPRIERLVRAVDGVAALDALARGFKPDFAIIDLQMPRKNGFSLLVELGCLDRAFPCIVLTSSTARTDWVRSKLRGAGDVLTKPDNVEALRELLDEALGAV